jgi:hypothetical protein
MIAPARSTTDRWGVGRCHSLSTEPSFRRVLDLVGGEINAIARDAARRWHCGVEDAEQEARLIAWQKHQRGLPAKLVVKYTRQAMLSGESPLAPKNPPRSSSEAEGMPCIGSFRSPLTGGQLRALARLSSSAFGGILARVEDEAPLRCPDCGGRGTWGNRKDPSPAPAGRNAGRCVENELEAAARWPMYDAPRKARDEQVWWCSRCGGWTWDPSARALEVALTEGQMRVHDDTTGIDGEAMLARYVQASEWWRQRHPHFRRTDDEEE